MKTHVAVFSMNIIQFFNEFMWSKNGFSFCNIVTLAQERKIYLKMALTLRPFTRGQSNNRTQPKRKKKYTVNVSASYRSRR